MSLVYSHVCLEISSARQLDGTAGLLGEICWTAARQTRIEPAGTDRTTHMYYIVDGNLCDDEAGNGPCWLAVGGESGMSPEESYPWEQHSRNGNSTISSAEVLCV